MAEETMFDSPEVGVTPEEAWTAIRGRNPSFDGKFYFAVTSTGIYCRPGCSSRTPRRENVRLFPTPGAAESAGFRACKRCHPRDHRPPAAQRSVEAARQYLDDHLDESVTLEQLARVAHMSAYHLQRTFKRYLGLTPREYVEARRAERLKERLRAGDTVTQATFEAGFGSASRVYAQADAHLGMTPAAYRRQGDGVRIRYVTTSTPLGFLLVAATERGVCAVTLGDAAAALEAELHREFPNALTESGADELKSRVDAIVAFLNGDTKDLQMPIDVQATAFQHRVWKALQEIPYGSTRSYREVAEAIGQPRASRAVASACASNRVALVIPCHRVVRGDGDPSGYRWGRDRKLQLLDQEAARSPR